MGIKINKHNIDGAFVLVLFAVFAVTIVAVLALGANQYKSLVERDQNAYNKKIITSYLAAKIRDHDGDSGVKVGSFSKERKDIQALHMYQDIEGEQYEVRIYYYEGNVYELFTLADLDMKPDAGSVIMEANSLSFKQEGRLIQIDAENTEGVKDTVVVGVRSKRKGSL